MIKCKYCGKNAPKKQQATLERARETFKKMGFANSGYICNKCRKQEAKA